MNWEDELREILLNKISLHYLQKDNKILESFIESLLKKERIEENEYWIGLTLNNENWTINKMDFEKRNLELR